MAEIRITQIKSTIGCKPNQVQTVRSLGLKRIGHVVIKEDRPEIRGMAESIPHLVDLKEID